MPKTTPAEWLLARFTGRDRAAAILGDLLEMKYTRGSLWFWTAYTRMLISLGWRTPVAFVAAIVCMRFIFRTFVPLLGAHYITHFLEDGLFGKYNLHVRLINWNLAIVMARFLIFALPFVVVRFGLRNRVTQLTGMLFLVAMPIYSLRPRLMDLSGVLILLITIAALCFPLWRRPMIVLVATALTTIVTTTSSLYLLVRFFHHAHFNFYLSTTRMALYDDIGLALTVTLFLYLNRKLLRQRAVIA